MGLKISGNILVNAFSQTIGDMIFVTVLYLFFKDFIWIRPTIAKRIFLVVISGAFAAVIFEKIALKESLWNYGNMPLIPVLNVGLLPVLQFAMLPLLSYYSGCLFFKDRPEY